MRTQLKVGERAGRHSGYENKRQALFQADNYETRIQKSKIQNLKFKIQSPQKTNIKLESANLDPGGEHTGNAGAPTQGGYEHDAATTAETGQRD